MSVSKGWVAGMALAVLAAVLVFLPACERPYRWAVPDGLPLPLVPADNPMSVVKVELGRRLFYDGRLSVNGATSCASCHRQELAFTDGLARSVGATGEQHPRGSMSLVNAAYMSRLTWANHLLDRLETQALTPMFGEEPVEMGMSGRESILIELLRSDPDYRVAFPRAFPGDEDPYSILNTVRALSAFVRTIVSFDSPYDRYLRGDSGALSAGQVEGMHLFFSERLECFHCHGGLNFTDSSTHANAVIENVGFHNTGLYNIDGAGGYPPGNAGLRELTGDRWDTGRFRAPTLRNIAVTAPYMHDGSIKDLPSVIDHYARGGRNIAEGPYAGDGARNPYKSEFLRGFELSGEERSNLLAFLEALTDRSVLSNEALSDPGPGTTSGGK